MGVEDIDIDIANNRTLAEDAIATTNVPSNLSSAMDGYAIKSLESVRASSETPIQFKILGSIFGNSNGERFRITGRETYYVSTGAPLPEDGDAVLKIENTKIINDNQIIITRPIAKGKNIVPIRQDFEKDQILGTQELRVCATLLQVVARAIGKLSPQPEILSLSPHNLEDVLQNVIEVAQVTGEIEKGRAILRSLVSRIEHVKSKCIDQKIPRPSVF